MIEFRDINFLIIGAAKSATTWLQQSLQQNPKIFMPDPELHYFSRYYCKGDEWYLSQFSKSEKQTHIGEKSNSYLDTPHSAARVYSVLPKVKLIAQLRNPVDRAYSDYCMLYRRGEVGKDIEQYLDPRYAHGKRFLSGGLYEQQLRAYLEHFPSSQLLVMFFEDLKTEAPRQLKIVQDFLQLDSNLPLLPEENKIKDKNQLLIGPALGRYLRPLKPIFAPFRKTLGFNYLRNLLAQKLEYVPLSDGIRNRMIDYYAPDVARLEKIVGKELTKWLEGEKV